MPAVENFVEVDQLLRQRVHLLSSGQAKVSIGGALRRGGLDLVCQAHETEPKVGIKQAAPLVRVFAQLQHHSRCLKAGVNEHGVRICLEAAILHSHAHEK